VLAVSSAAGGWGVKEESARNGVRAGRVG
jgi:hypothetical protein